MTGSSIAQGQTDFTFDQLVRLMETDSLSYYSTQFGYTATVNIPYGGNYTFDSVAVSWNSYATPINISDLMVVRYA
jgi:hypothetical protein